MIALIIYLIGVIIAIIFPIRHLTTKYNINLLQLVVILIYSLGSWATFFCFSRSILSRYNNFQKKG